MTNPKKIELSQAEAIPFDKLVLSKRNVRRTQADLSIAELADDIAQRGLLQSLSVRPIMGADGAPTGKYEVQAGGRRLRALGLLVKQKRIGKTAPIPCIVKDDGILEEDSLAENLQRQALHPVDQFRAFQTLREQGLGEEEIAARFFTTAQIVRQRLKLASVSPKLLDLYVAEDMTLEQLMAFTVSDDQARQEQVWETTRQSHYAQPYQIRRLLTEHSVSASDRRVRFIGLDAYEAAGGAVTRDLFSTDETAWVQDVPLLERLVAGKLEAAAETVRAEGWAWVKVAEDFHHGYADGLRPLKGEEIPLTDEEDARRAELCREAEALEARYASSGEDLSKEDDRRLAEIEEELEAFENRPVRFAPGDIARAGAFVTIDRDGELEVDRGWVAPDAQPGDAAASARNGDAAAFAGDHIAVRQVGQPAPTGAGGGEAESEEDGLKPLSSVLMSQLTAHRTLGLCNALADDPDTAFLAALHALALQTFYDNPVATCLEISARTPGLRLQAPDLGGSAAARTLADRHRNWEQSLPEEPEELWAALAGLDAAARASLFAHCVGLTVNAVLGAWNDTVGRKRHADQLATASRLDMAAAGWAPTADNYFDRVPKARILEAVTEAKGEREAQLIDHLTKREMAKEAERMLAGTGWLPECLRTPAIDDAPAAVDAPDTDDGGAPEERSELPAFLTAAE